MTQDFTDESNHPISGMEDVVNKERLSLNRVNIL